MPSNLDDKLTSIWMSARNTVEAIPQIKQAFTDAGYVKPTVPSNKAFFELPLVTDDGQLLLTGQEWYDRFIREFNYAVHLKGDTKLTSKGVVQCVESAAKRAAGLEGDTHAR